MAAPSRLNPERLFRPVGNSQPANFVQYLAREKPAKILSLGCGDVRNILFTAYCDADNDRPMDITCCDIEKAVIARNILLLSVLIDDDATGGTDNLLFKLCFDMVLDEATFQLFRKQGRKLRQRSKSLEKWHNCAYGKVIRFCDSESLCQVREVWESYSVPASSDISRFDQVKERSKRVGVPGVSVEMAEAFAPFLVTLDHKLRNFHEDYWKTGMVEPHAEIEDQNLYWNPTYSFQGDQLILHPGTCPTEGFNLALGLAPFDESSPLFAAPCNGIGSVDCCLESMRIQFRAWGNAFSRCCRRESIILRFVVSDALAFCYTLAVRKSWAPKIDDLSRGPMTNQTLSLDSPDYASRTNIPLGAIPCYLAPIAFNAIDTSSLADRCGAINILLATVGLIHGSLESTLVTEMCLKERKSLPNVVCPSLPGDFMTLMMLIGFSPVEFLSNNTSTPTYNKNFLMTMQKRIGKDAPMLKMRICWKSCCCVGDIPIDAQFLFRGQQYMPKQLGKLFYRTYCRMFRKGDKVSEAFNSTPASFAALLHKIKSSEAARWPDVMANMMDHFRTDPYDESRDKDDDLEADEGPTEADQDFSEMLVQLERFGVYNLVDSLPLTGQPKTKKAYSNHITLVVPRRKVEWPYRFNLTKLGGQLSVECTIKQPGQITHRFSVLRLTFGLIHPSAKQFGRRAWRLVIHEDPLGWTGTSPLFVTFSAPPSLLTDPKVKVHFGLKKTPQALEIFGSSLGPDLTLFETNLGKADEIFVCNDSPIACTALHTAGETQPEDHANSSGYPPLTLQNLAGHDSQLPAPTFGPSMPPALPADVERADSVISWNSDDAPIQPDSFVTCIIKPCLSPSSSSLEAFSAHIECHSDDWKTAVRKNAEVSAVQMTPCSFALRVKGSTRQLCFSFPFPVEDRVLLAFVPSKSIIIFTVVPADPAGNDVPVMKSSFIAFEQISIQGHPYLPLDRLPALDQSQLDTFDPLRHLMRQMHSIREAELEKLVIRTEDIEAKELRAGIKTGLRTLFNYFCGLEVKRKKSLFVFTQGCFGEQFYIIVSAMRIDMANQSFVLDAAVIPVTRENRTRVRQMFCKIDDKHSEWYIMSAAEVLTWKLLLTTGVERARTWSHKPDCEYKTCGHVPTSHENHVNFLCTCGNGKLPSNFLKNPPCDWDKVKDMAVRVAISPSYSSMMVEAQTPPRMHEKSFGPADLGKPEYVPQCFECRKKYVDVPLKRCGRCNTATYCSRECQVKNHGTHQHACGHYRTARANMG